MREDDARSMENDKLRYPGMTGRCRTGESKMKGLIGAGEAGTMLWRFSRAGNTARERFAYMK